MEVGSFIRIPLYDITNPWRYGTIKWIGNLENIQGKIAGIELVRIHGCINSKLLSPLMFGLLVKPQ